jgi:hypothetical protein
MVKDHKSNLNLMFYDFNRLDRIVCEERGATRQGMRSEAAKRDMTKFKTSTNFMPRSSAVGGFRNEKNLPSRSGSRKETYKKVGA